MKNKILAIEAAPAAIPPKPNTAAIIATTKNMIVQRNITKSFKLINIVFSSFDIPFWLLRHDPILKLIFMSSFFYQFLSILHRYCLIPEFAWFFYNHKRMIQRRFNFPFRSISHMSIHLEKFMPQINNVEKNNTVHNWGIFSAFIERTLF